MAKTTFDLWEKIFDAKKYDTNLDLHFITADEIKELTKAEARIMAKMDSTLDLPPIFQKNGYFLLPVRNGNYAIVRGNGFHQLEKRGEIKEHISRIKFPLATAARGMSEMQYLDYGFNAGVIEAAVGKEPLYQTIRGREYTKDFRFLVNKTWLDVGSVQIEVDSGLEGKDSIVLLEAKMDTPEDFIIRQLFYPYNRFKALVPQKQIIPVFFTYEPVLKVYNFWIYEIADPTNYNSILLKETKSYTIRGRDELTIHDIKPAGVVYKQLVPQADSVNKIIEFVFKVSEGIANSKDIATHFEFDTRQSSYYREAAEALGLILIKDGKYVLTDAGTQFINLPVEKRNLYFASLISDFDLVKYSMEILKERGYLLKEDIEKIIAENSAHTGSTISRRAQTIVAWLRWMSDATNAFSEEDEKGKFVLRK